MSDTDFILQKLRSLGMEESKVIREAVQEHLEELEDIAAYDAAKASGEPTESLEAVMARYPKAKSA
jgi:predicted DNA-binding protein